MVPPEGFEPPIFASEARRLSPLDEGGELLLAETYRLTATTVAGYIWIIELETVTSDSRLKVDSGALEEGHTFRVDDDPDTIVLNDDVAVTNVIFELKNVAVSCTASTTYSEPNTVGLWQPLFELLSHRMHSTICNC